MVDFWDEQAEKSVDAPPAPRFQDLPDKTWLVCRTCTAENGGAAPRIDPVTTKHGDSAKLNLGFIIEGGEGSVPRSKEGSYIFSDFWVKKMPEETANIPVAGDLYNLMLDTLAPEGEDVNERWQTTRTQLAEKGREMSLNKDDYHGDMEMVYAVAFRGILLEKSFQVAGRTYTRKQTPGSTYVPKQQLGSIEAYTGATKAKRKLALFSEPSRTAF